MQVIDDAGANGISVEGIGLEAAYSLKGSTFKRYLSGLKQTKLAVERNGIYTAGAILFPERV